MVKQRTRILLLILVAAVSPILAMNASDPVGQVSKKKRGTRKPTASEQDFAANLARGFAGKKPPQQKPKAQEEHKQDRAKPAALTAEHWMTTGYMERDGVLYGMATRVNSGSLAGARQELDPGLNSIVALRQRALAELRAQQAVDKAELEALRAAGLMD